MLREGRESLSSQLGQRQQQKKILLPQMSGLASCSETECPVFQMPPSRASAGPALTASHPDGWTLLACVGNVRVQGGWHCRPHRLLGISPMTLSHPPIIWCDAQLGRGGRVREQRAPIPTRAGGHSDHGERVGGHGADPSPPIALLWPVLYLERRRKHSAGFHSW